MISGYKASGSDYMNFHWYIADTQALEEAVSYLRSLSGLEVMTNEMGQQSNEDPNQVTNMMKAVLDLKFPYAVWFSVDVAGYGEARGLVDEDGKIRQNGEAFQSFIQNNFY